MSTIKANTLLHSDGTTTTQPSIPALDQRMAKAWVNFNGVGTVAIRSSYNVSSITDNATGNYYINYASAPSDNHAVTASGGFWGCNPEINYHTSAARVQIVTRDIGNANMRDADILCITAFSN